MTGYDPRGTGRPSATVTAVMSRSLPEGKRQDTDYVVARFDYADGKVWWIADHDAVKVGDRFLITIEAMP